MTIVLGSCALVIAATMFIVWLLSLVRKDASIVDIAWGLGFVIVAWAAYVLGRDGDFSFERMLLPALTTIWGIRLSGYLFWRNHGKPEDYRYRAMREKWGKRFPLISLITVFALQGFIMWIVALPIQVGPTSFRQPNSQWLILAGVLIWGAGFAFESIGDWQLARFKSNPKNVGLVMDTGLWRYTRHPNYFGDFLVWWGLFLVSFATTGIAWTAVGPAVMSIFLMRVSGVTLLERSLRKTKPNYARYCERTSAFFPLPPRGG